MSHSLYSITNHLGFAVLRCSSVSACHIYYIQSQIILVSPFCVVPPFRPVTFTISNHKSSWFRRFPLFRRFRVLHLQYSITNHLGFAVLRCFCNSLVIDFNRNFRRSGEIVDLLRCSCICLKMSYLSTVLLARQLALHFQQQTESRRHNPVKNSTKDYVKNIHECF